MSDIDEYLQGRKISEAEEALNDAKKRLEEEKARLKEEQKRAKVKEKEAAKHKVVERHTEISTDAESTEESVSSGYRMQPWMLWNLIILGLVIILFGVSMFYPKNIDDAAVNSIVDQKLAAQRATTESELNTLEKKIDSGLNPVQEKKVVTSVVESTNAVGPKFLLNAKDISGTIIGNKGVVDVINGTKTEYTLIIENKEKKTIRCDADRSINGNDKKTVFKNLKVEVSAPEDIPAEIVKDEASMKLKFDFSCHFEDDDSADPATTKQSIEFTFNFK